MFQKHFPEGFQQTPWAARGKFLGQGPGGNREGIGKSQRLIDLCPRGARRRQRARARGSRPASATRLGASESGRAAPRYLSHRWCHVTPRAFVSRRGQIKGSAQAVGLWPGKDKASLNPNREAGLLEVPRRRMLAPGGHPQSSCIRTSIAGRTSWQEHSLPRSARHQLTGEGEELI